MKPLLVNMAQAVAEKSPGDVLLDRSIAAAVLVAVIWLGIAVIVPLAWRLAEGTWWRLRLGKSPTSRIVIRFAIHDIELAIQEQVAELHTSRPVAVPIAACRRVIDLFSGYGTHLRAMKQAKHDSVYRSTRENLVAGWRDGLPPKVLKAYVRDLALLAKEERDGWERHLALCSVANTTYLLGDLTAGYRTARRNWTLAKTVDAEDRADYEWAASYAYFNSQLFLGKFRRTMDNMALFWHASYAPLDEPERKQLIDRLATTLNVNPVLSIPRHMILGAAFLHEDERSFDHLPGHSENTVCSIENTQQTSVEMSWVNSWYEAADEMCPATGISRDFTNVYTGFYYTLLAARRDFPDAALAGTRAKEALATIDDSSAVVSKYAGLGFLGIHKAIAEPVDIEEALACLRKAAQHSAVSGNQFLDCLFKCCHAVVAENAIGGTRAEADYYMKEARRSARRIGSGFHRGLCEAAQAAIYKSRGSARAKRCRRRAEHFRINQDLLQLLDSTAATESR